jgi:hypothetical protein
LFGVLAALPLYAAEATLSGRVVDEDDTPVRQARVVVSASPQGNTWNAVTGPDGTFSLVLPSPGDFLISVECEGYYPLERKPVRLEASQEFTLTLNSVREVFQSTDVNEKTSPLDMEQTQNQERLSGTEVNNIPFSSSHSLVNSMTLMPGVVQDASGTTHVNGASDNQILYLLNGFNITNPISGRYQTLLAVEGIRSLDLNSARISPQFGQGSAGALAIETEGGTDTWHYTATDFVPGLDTHSGLHLGNWYPRFGVSGPIVRGRAWFSDTFDAEYNESVVTGLPSGQNTNSGWATSNLLHTQWNLTSSNILFSDFLINNNDQNRVGLGALSPVSTTSTLGTREVFISLKDQVYLGHGTLAEFGYAHTDYSSTQTPQGDNLYVISPEGASGNYFVNDTQSASRDEGLVHAYLPQWNFAGTHQFEAGASGDWLSYSADFRDTGYNLVGLNGQLISQTLFSAPARFQVRDTEAAAYLRDTWRVSRRLQFTLGVREDWDQLVKDSAWSPRLGFAWSPFSSSRTKISGGYSITHDAVTLDAFGQPLNQVAATTSYDSSGLPAGPASLTTFAVPGSGLKLPRAQNWNLNWDHQIGQHVYLTAKYIRRRSSDEFAFVNELAPEAPPSLLPFPNGTASGVYQLTNLRRDDYDAVQFSVHQTFSGQYEWTASYVRSRALSNAVLDPSSPQPLETLAQFVPMPWDAPNRFLAWTYLPLPRKNWAVSALADLRSGFPFSVRDQTGVVVGPVDSYRYPLNFDLNLAIERMVTLHGYRFALRGGVDNLLDRPNPTAVNNVLGAPQFLQFVGDEGRHFVVRIRFFGRAGNGGSLP